MTNSEVSANLSTSLRAVGSARKRYPMREAIQLAVAGMSSRVKCRCDWHSPAACRPACFAAKQLHVRDKRAHDAAIATDRNLLWLRGKPGAIVLPTGRRPMTSAERPARKARAAHVEEWWSILAALVGAGATTLFLWQVPDFRPSGDLTWVVPGWLALAYVLLQIACLLVSAAQIRALGVVDSIVAIVPVVAAIVTGIEWFLGRLALSPFQINVLATLLVASTGEFLLTMWTRFVLNRRTVSVESGDI
jgi:hypothetical protein